MIIQWNFDAALVFAVSVVVFLVVAGIQYGYLRPVVIKFVERLDSSKNDLGQSWEQLEAEMALNLARVQTVSAILSTFPALFFVLRPAWDLSGFLVFVIYVALVALVLILPNRWVRRPRRLVRRWRKMNLPDVSLLGLWTFVGLVAITIAVLLFDPYPA